MTERGRSMPTESSGGRDTVGTHRSSVPPLRDPSLELFGGTGDDVAWSAPPEAAYTGRHRAADA